MITGFNQEVSYRGMTIHVQTEDKGPDNPLVLTLIYKGGEILGSRRTTYTDLVKPGDEKALKKLMEDQHNAIISEVKRGKYDPDGDKTLLDDLSLDEIVLAYLAQRAAQQS